MAILIDLDKSESASSVFILLSIQNGGQLSSHQSLHRCSLQNSRMSWAFFYHFAGAAVVIQQAAGELTAMTDGKGCKGERL